MLFYSTIISKLEVSFSPPFLTAMRCIDALFYSPIRVMSATLLKIPEIYNFLSFSSIVMRLLLIYFVTGKASLAIYHT